MRVLELYAEAERHSAPMNMAIDEALLEFARVPAIRFYGWRGPAVSFGYFGHYTDVAPEESRREIVRRWTGGGIVMHGADLTYSVILPARETTLPPAREIYEQVHDAIRRALSSHIRASLAVANAPKLSDACFANPVVADVLVNGRKIAGAAQRRTRAGLLHQGSIQLENLPPDFPEALARELCPSFEKHSFTPDLLARASELTERKYGTQEWLRRR